MALSLARLRPGSSLRLCLRRAVTPIFEGAPIAVVRIEGQVPPYALLAQRTIKTIAELRGKTIMVGGEKDITRGYLERMLTPNGIKAGEYDLLYAGSTLARFAGRGVGGHSVSAFKLPSRGRRLQQSGLCRRLRQGSSVLGDFGQYVVGDPQQRTP